MAGRHSKRSSTFGQDLSSDVVYNARVREIEKNGDRLSVIVEHPTTRQQTAKPFDLVLLAVPFSALRHIRMFDLINTEKRRAIRQLHYDNSCKIILEFNRRFWAHRRDKIHGPIIGGRSITDLPIRQVYYPIPEQNPDSADRDVLLASYTWGDDSLRWTSLKKDDRVRFALRDLEGVHDSRGKLSELLVGGTSHSWAEDEFTSGAFAMFQPYQLIELFQHVWMPDGLIHYCGEHTSRRHGWIEGAVESAVRVADEICTRIVTDDELVRKSGRASSQG